MAGSAEGQETRPAAHHAALQSLQVTKTHQNPQQRLAVHECRRHGTALVRAAS